MLIPRYLAWLGIFVCFTFVMQGCSTVEPQISESNRQDYFPSHKGNDISFSGFTDDRQQYKKIESALDVNQRGKRAGLATNTSAIGMLSYFSELKVPGKLVRPGDTVVVYSEPMLYGLGTKFDHHTELYQEGTLIGKPRILKLVPPDGVAGTYAIKVEYKIPAGWSGRTFTFGVKIFADGKLVSNKTASMMKVM